VKVTFFSLKIPTCRNNGLSEITGCRNYEVNPFVGVGAT